MNVLAYWSNSNNKSNETYVVKYIKSLEQSISQAIIFRGRLGNCFSNIVRFLLPLWTLSMWLILTNGLIVEMWGEAWNVLVQLVSPWSPVIATRRAHPREPTGPRRMRNPRTDWTKPMVKNWSQPYINDLQSNHRHDWEIRLVCMPLHWE